MTLWYIHVHEIELKYHGHYKIQSSTIGHIHYFFLQTPIPEEDVDKSLWGEMEEESSSEEESEEEEEEEEDASGLVTPGPEG